MESKLTNICAQLSPGVSGFALILLAFPGLAIGGAGLGLAALIALLHWKAAKSGLIDWQNR